MNKSIKIKLSAANSSKQEKLRDVVSLLEEISTQYLAIKKKELKSRDYSESQNFYRKIRESHPQLNSIILQQCQRHVDGLVTAHISTCKKKKKLVKFPEKTKCPIGLRNDSFRFEYNEKTKSFDAWIRFLRTNFPLKLCDYHRKVLAEMESVRDSKISIDHKGNLCVILVVKMKCKENTSTKTLGVDIGIEKPIVCSDGKMFGSGKYIRHKKLEFGKRRAKNQKKKEKISSKQARWTNDLNHKLSRKLVNYCLQQGIDVLGLEALKGNHLANTRFRRYSWAFRDLLSKIEYKALEAGLKVVSVNPKYTSQRCSSCGSKSKDNRKSQSKFHCSYCKVTLNADVNASKNICGLSAADGLNVNPARSKDQTLKITPFKV